MMYLTVIKGTKPTAFSRHVKIIMIHQQRALRFKCTGCGKCCTGGEDHYIAMSKMEAQRIQKHLGISSNWFRRRYVTHLTRNTLTARMHKGQCVFLSDSGKCQIYKLRPVQCRTYPYWPELLENKRVWDNEATHCEGINVGNVVPITDIKLKLAMQLKSEEDDV